MIGHSRHHEHIDRLARFESPIHALDPRAKILCVLFFVGAVVRTEPSGAWKLPIFFALAIVCALAGRLPLGLIARRTVMALPFLACFALFTPFLPLGAPVLGFRVGGRLFAIYDGALAYTGMLVAKAALSIAAATVLVATTRFHLLLRGLERLKVPRALVLALQFLHRYLFVLVEEGAAMLRAREARLVGRLSPGASVRSGAGIVGALFLRTFERAERIQAAMASRGFDGEVRTLEVLDFRVRDVVAVALGGAAAAGLALS